MHNTPALDAPVISTETLQALLAVAGWVVAFLLGKELATGYSQWRAQRAERAEQAAEHEAAENNEVDRR